MIATHTQHPDVHIHGLADGCPRCAEHAESPHAALDADMLAALRRRVITGATPRSAAEARAMQRLAQTTSAGVLGAHRYQHPVVHLCPSPPRNPR